MVKERTGEAGRVVAGSRFTLGRGCRDKETGLFFVKMEQEKKSVRRNMEGFEGNKSMREMK